MRKCLAYHQVIASCFGMGLVIGAVPTIANAASLDRPSKVGSVAFDAGQQVLSIPVRGSVPQVHLVRVAAHQYIADLPHCILERSEVQGQRTDGSSLYGWSVDEMPTGETVRLRLTLNGEVAPAVHFVRNGASLTLAFGATPAVSLARGSHKIETPFRTAIASTRSSVAFPFAAPIVHQRALGPLRPDTRNGDRPIVLTTLAAAPVAHRTASNGSYALAARSRFPSMPARPSYPLMLSARSLPLAALQLTDRSLPNSVAFVPRVPAGLKLPMVAAAPAVFRPAAATGRASDGSATLKPAYYDVHRGCLVIPVSGSLNPNSLEVVRLNKRWAYLDVPSSHPTFSGVRFEERKDKLFQRWVMAKRPHQQTTRVSFALGSPAEIDCKVEGQQLLVAIRPQTVILAHKPSAPSAAVVSVAAMSAPALPTLSLLKQNSPVAFDTRSTPALAAAPKQPSVKSAVLALAPVAVENTPGNLGRPFFDRDRFGLVIPYVGQAPLYRWTKRNDETVALELQGSLASAGRMTQSFAHDPLLAGWQVERGLDAGTVKVALNFRRPADVVIAADPGRHQLVLIPQPKLVGGEENVMATTVTPTTLSILMGHQDGRHLFIPYQGPVPTYAVDQVSADFANIDFPATKLATEAVQFFAPEFHPTLNYWLLSQRPDRGVRLSLALTQAGTAKVFQDRINQRLVIELGGSNPVVGARSVPKMPALWPGEQRQTGSKPAGPVLEVSRRAS
jgi:hypothetical protein